MGVYEHLHRVAPAEIDVMGHANNLCYLRWMLAAATAHSEALGWPFERYRQLGSAWVVRAHKIEYIRPVFADEEIVVRTWVSAAKRASSTRRYHMHRRADAALVASAVTDWAFVDLKTGRVMRVPPEVANSFEALGDSP